MSRFPNPETKLSVSGARDFDVSEEPSTNPYEVPMNRGTGRQHAIVRGAVPRVIEFTGFVAAGIVSPIVGFVTLMSFLSLSLAWFFFAIVFGLATMSVSFVIVVRLFVRISERFRIDE